ncbi:Fe(3+) ABC transporter substrate-binding protein [Terasakiella pusilla]|uniref:Fe(3+) ABC transporter substrate-binding protein n=1 Tax=Terasakiella pusilla TaxID=64973 RepID=UPI000490696C|nr:Fe(3+) ABC transporter substrate-binding protein [Terasakiella pusilla]
MHTKMFRKSFLSLLAGACALTGLSAATASAEEVNVYSYRQEILIRPLLDRFTAQTGIDVNLVNGKADVLLERLKSEGMNSPADILLTADVGRLIRAQKADVLQPVSSDTLSSLIPTKYRDPEGNWFGLSLRSRVIFAAKDRVKEGEIKTYEDLTDPKWKGRICIRSSTNVYNQSLLGAMIAHKGAEEAAKWAEGIVANLARKPQGGDRDQIKAVASGQCDVAIGNTYYLGKMLAGSDEKQKEAASKVFVVWPNQDGRGSHVNISGAGVTKSAKHKEAAIKLIEFLASDEAQKVYTEEVFEYPLRDGIEVSETVASWGKFKADDIELAKIAEHQAEAVRIFDKAGWR